MRISLTGSSNRIRYVQQGNSLYCGTFYGGPMSNFKKMGHLVSLLVMLAV